MRSLLVLALSLIGLGTGCTATQQANFDQSVLTHAAGIQGTAALTTRLALLSVPAKDKVKATNDVHAVGLAIQSVLRESNPTITDLKSFVMGIVGQSNSPYVELVATVIDVSSGLIDVDLQQFYASATASQRQVAALQLMRGVVDGIVSGSQGIVSVPRPATQPSAQNFVTLPKRTVVASPFDTRAG